LVAFQIDDMTCGHCAAAITKAVHAVDAEAKVDIDLALHRVEIGQTQATSLDLASAIVGAGFVPMQLDAAESEIPGPSAGCGGCGGGCR
jgi:copper chaperone